MHLQLADIRPGSFTGFSLSSTVADLSYFRRIITSYFIYNTVVPLFHTIVNNLYSDPDL